MFTTYRIYDNNKYIGTVTDKHQANRLAREGFTVLTIERNNTK
jgi:hypothetical protein